MSNKNAVKAMTLIAFNGNGITGSLQAMSATGFPGPVFKLRVMNATDKDIAISYDGKKAHEYIIKGTTLDLDFQNNAQPNNWASLMKKGTILYVSGEAATGYIYISAYYLENQ